VRSEKKEEKHKERISRIKRFIHKPKKEKEQKRCVFLVLKRRIYLLHIYPTAF